MTCDLERIKKLINYLASINATPGEGVTRFSYSDEDKRARQYIIGEMKKIGLVVSVDSVGNIRGRLNGKNNSAPPILTGSHIDSVFHGGKFDGIVGVIGALEVLSTISEQRIVPSIPIEIIIFAEEEGSNFNSTMAGSKTLTGVYTTEDLKHIYDKNGRSMFNAAIDFGLYPNKVKDYIIKKGDISAMIELHVEQGVVLDKEKIPVGIVKAIFGSKCLQVSIDGQANHAGATPMHLRHDPMVAAAYMITKVNEITMKYSKSTVATIGKIACVPNVSNCIAKNVNFTIDIRDDNMKGIDRIYEYVLSLSELLKSSFGVDVQVQLLSKSDPVQLSHQTINIIKECADKLGCQYMLMNSGAVHDSAMLASITNVAMIFVPSIDGRSHVPEESTSWEDIKLGCDLLLNSILTLAQ